MAITQPAADGSDIAPYWPHSGVRYPRDGKFPGTDIVGKPGDLVYAVTGGVVVWTAEFRGFNTMVIVETDDGYQYVYGGTDTVSVEKYERVPAGAEIGRLGVDPNSGEARLFFTVMKNGEIIDPELAPRG